MAQQLARRMQIPAEQTMAIGDHDSDAALLHWAGIGVAMGNATPAAKGAADVITSSNLRDGVAEALEHWVLGRRTMGALGERAQSQPGGRLRNRVPASRDPRRSAGRVYVPRVPGTRSARARPGRRADAGEHPQPPRAKATSRAITRAAGVARSTSSPRSKKPPGSRAASARESSAHGATAEDGTPVWPQCQDRPDEHRAEPPAPSPRAARATSGRPDRAGRQCWDFIGS